MTTPFAPLRRKPSMKRPCARGDCCNILLHTQKKYEEAGDGEASGAAFCQRAEFLCLPAATQAQKTTKAPVKNTRTTSVRGLYQTSGSVRPGGYRIQGRCEKLKKLLEHKKEKNDHRLTAICAILDEDQPG
jgi:hypothetical protein